MFFFKKKTTKEKVAEKRTNFAGESMDHLDAEGNLPFGWHRANKEFTDKISEEYKYFSDRCYEAKNLSPKEYYEVLKSAVLYLEDAQKLCYSKNVCFAHWFDGCVASPEHIAEEKQGLQELENNLEQLQKEWERHQFINKEIIEIIKENAGIMQSDLYKRFDAADKNYISNTLYMMDAKGEIERVKQGRSYALHIKRQE